MNGIQTARGLEWQLSFTTAIILLSEKVKPFASFYQVLLLNLNDAASAHDKGLRWGRNQTIAELKYE